MGSIYYFSISIYPIDGSSSYNVCIDIHSQTNSRNRRGDTILKRKGIEEREVALSLIIIIGLVFLIAVSEQPNQVTGSQKIVAPPVPFMRTFGQGGFANTQTLSDNKPYIKLTNYLSAVFPPNLYNEGVFSGLQATSVAYYPFDESSGTTTADISPTQNFGTLTCAGVSCVNPTFVSGFYGNALSFTATATTASYVTIPSGANNNNLDTFSICFAFKTTGTQQATSTLAEKWDGVQNKYPYSFRLIGGVIGFKAFDGANNPSANTAASTYADGNPHLICGARKAQSTLTIYADNTTPVTVTDTTAVGSETNTSPLGIGDRIGNTAVGCLCIIDNFQIFNIVLEPAQFTQFYQYFLQYSKLTPLTNTPTPILLESGIQSTLPPQINSAVSGTTITWSAKWTAASVTSGYDIYPIGAEDAPGFANGVILFWNGASGVWQCQANALGAGTVVNISAPTPDVIHTFKIVFVTAGSQVTFSVDGSIVATINSNVPATTLSPFIELSNIGSANNLAQLWGFGGQV